MSETNFLPTEEVSAGKTLKRHRIERRLSVEKIASELNLTTAVITALEADDYAQLPEPVYTRGYIHAYATLLQLDSKPLLQSHSTATQGTQTLRPVPGLDVALNRFPRKLMLLTATVAIILIGLALAHWMQERTQRSTSQTRPTSLAVPVEPAQPEQLAADTVGTGKLAAWQNLEQRVVRPDATWPGTAAQDAALLQNIDSRSTHVADGQLLLRFTEQCWVEIRDVHGQLLISKLVEAGEQLRIGGQKPLSVLLGNAQGVTVEYAGRPVAIKPFTRNNIARLTVGADDDAP